MALFEELAERLAHADHPQARIEAAEELADLNDPRVAPLLAKALADPDPSVRLRIEELLAQFCRRDHTGNLQLLLAEAERVAEALEAEVRGLRGEAGPEAPPVAIDPIEPPPHYRGECALVRLAPRPDDIKRAAKIVARALRKPAFEVARDIRTTQGFLARDVPVAVARELVRELHKAGTVAGAVPMDRLPRGPELSRLRGLRLEPDALRGSRVPSGTPCEIPWSTVELVVAARLEVELRRDARHEDWRLYTRPIRPREDGGAHEAGSDYLLDLFGGQPLMRLRLGGHELDFVAMQRRPSSFNKVAKVAARLLRHVDRRRISAGVRRLAERDEESWDDLTFLSPLGYEDYVTWQRLLLALGVPLPR